MAESNTQLADSKKEPQKSTVKRWYVISRIRSITARAALNKDDEWGLKIEFYSEAAAKTEFTWLNNHANVREYMLISVEVPDGFTDDEIPF